MQTEVVQRLYGQFGDQVFRYILSRVRNYADAEDLRSEVFVKAMANIERYDSGRAAYSTWIYTITRNVVNDYFRSRLQTQVELDDVLIDPMDAGSWDQELSELAEALQKCSQRERDVMVLRYYHGYPYAEIAEKLHLSSANVRMISHRTSRKLRELIRTM